MRFKSSRAVVSDRLGRAKSSWRRYIGLMTSPAPKVVSIADAPDEAAEARALAEAEADVKSGKVVSHDAIKRWLLSWGTRTELPPPECE